MFNFFLFIFLCSIFLLNSFGFGSNIYPLRFVLPISALYIFLSIVLNLFRDKKRIQIPTELNVLFLVFSYIFFHTICVTCYRYIVESISYDVIDILNFAVLIVFVFVLIFYAVVDKVKMKQNVLLCTKIFYLLYTAFAFFEIIYGVHLPTSNLFDAEEWMKNIPTVVYYNSNDFAAIFTIMFIYLFSEYQIKNNNRLTIFVVFAVLIHFFILYKTQSRLSIVVLFIFLFYKHPKPIIYSSFLLLMFLFLQGFYADNISVIQLVDNLLELKQDLSFGERNSTGVRFSLYKHAIMSVFENWGFGYGINASASYYEAIMDPNLFHITNPHSFIFELLINSGVVSTFLYIGLNVFLVITNWINQNENLIVQIIMFNLLLFSSSSSLFLWPIYLFLIVYVIDTITNH